MLVWKTQTLNVNVASLRYRCLLPLRYLNQQGIRSAIVGGSDSAKLTRHTQAIVFVKSFRAADVTTCEQAYQLGVPIILDLCDNIFIDGYAADSDYNPAHNFALMASRAAAIVTTGTAMKAEVERALAPLTPAPLVIVIPDGNETLDDIDFAFNSTRWQRIASLIQRRILQKAYWPLKVSRRLYRRGKRRLKVVVSGVKGKWGVFLRQRGWLAAVAEPIALSQLERVQMADAADVGAQERQHQAVRSDFDHTLGQKTTGQKKKKRTLVQPTPLRPAPWTAAAAGVKTVLWFGNHGAKYGNFGMLNILEVAPALAAVSQQLPLRLMVVSNSRQQYEAMIAPLPFETSYLPWHPRQIYDYIRASDVVIIPNSQSVYSICKSANRAVLALSQGTPVVASQTPALAMFAEGVWLDDWAAGLRTYLTDPGVAQRHVAKAQQVIYQHLRGEAIAQQWLALLQSLQADSPPDAAHCSSELLPDDLRIVSATAQPEEMP